MVKPTCFYDQGAMFISLYRSELELALQLQSDPKVKI